MKFKHFISSNIGVKLTAEKEEQLQGFLHKVCYYCYYTDTILNETLEQYASSGLWPLCKNFTLRELFGEDVYISENLTKLSNPNSLMGKQISDVFIKVTNLDQSLINSEVVSISAEYQNPETGYKSTEALVFRSEKLSSLVGELDITIGKDEEKQMLNAAMMSLYKTASVEEVVTKRKLNSIECIKDEISSMLCEKEAL